MSSVSYTLVFRSYNSFSSFHALLLSLNIVSIGNTLHRETWVMFSSFLIAYIVKGSSSSQMSSRFVVLLQSLFSKCRILTKSPPVWFYMKIINSTFITVFTISLTEEGPTSRSSFPGSSSGSVHPKPVSLPRPSTLGFSGISCHFITSGLVHPRHCCFGSRYRE